jgi:hypothetical protein
MAIVYIVFIVLMKVQLARLFANWLRMKDGKSMKNLKIKDKRTKEEMELDDGKVLDNFQVFMIRYGLEKYRGWLTDFIHSN